MPKAPGRFHPNPVRSKPVRQHALDQRRGSARKRGYGRPWEKARAGHLASRPLCAYCALHQRVTAATTVDHLYPHKGDTRIFWLKLYWVSTCTPCHSGFKQAVERRGRPALDHLAHRLGLPPLAA